VSSGERPVGEEGPQFDLGALGVGGFRRRRDSVLLIVVVEEEDNGVGKGRNRNDKLVYVQDASTVTGQVVDVLIDRTSPWSGEY